MADQQIHLVDHTDDENTPRTESSPHTPDAHIDVLFENQRGWFVFGIPLFSSKALWNFKIDPAPWVDSKFKPSAVNITNAQVPDPSWAWDWKSWYVDMSPDVDEEGWQYSLLFKGSAWHGNHPWFHSFVRRRCWLRKRVKQRRPPKSKETAHERMFGETFSIGTTLARSGTVGTLSVQDSSTSLDEEVKDIATLMIKLKKAAIDREKIIFIHKFIDDGGEELHYLAEHVRTASSDTRDLFWLTVPPRFHLSCPCLYSRTLAANSSQPSSTASTPPSSRVSRAMRPKNAALSAFQRPSRRPTSSFSSV
jgi:hypothetical protein